MIDSFTDMTPRACASSHELSVARKADERGDEAWAETRPSRPCSSFFARAEDDIDAHPGSLAAREEPAPIYEGLIGLHESFTSP